MNASPRASQAGIACLVLAAGAGSRFGTRKQLAELGGRPLLEHAVAAANAAPVERVVVVLGADAEEIAAGVRLGRAERVICEAWEDGLAASLKRGIRAAADAEAALVLLGDQPLVGVAAIERLLAARGPDRVAVRATYGGRPGHPVVFERPLFAAVAELSGDAGARDLLDCAGVVGVPCDDIADPLDVDSPADLELAAARLRERGG